MGRGSKVGLYLGRKGMAVANMVRPQEPCGGGKPSGSMPSIDPYTAGADSISAREV